MQMILKIENINKICTQSKNAKHQMHSFYISFLMQYFIGQQFWIIGFSTSILMHRRQFQSQTSEFKIIESDKWSQICLKLSWIKCKVIWESQNRSAKCADISCVFSIIHVALHNLKAFEIECQFVLFWYMTIILLHKSMDSCATWHHVFWLTVFCGH